MANYGLMNKPYIKYGNRENVCYVCSKEKSLTEKLPMDESVYRLKGHLEHKQTFYINKRGEDTCICFDCFKRVYKEIISAEMPIEEKEEEVTEKAVEEEVKEEPKKTSNSKKNNKKA